MKEDKQSEWNFDVVDSDWMWTITQPDGRKMTAPRRFSTLEACIDDAKLHGYLDPITKRSTAMTLNPRRSS